jgi:hypothetical protein
MKVQELAKIVEELSAKVLTLESTVESLEEKISKVKVRDRGPKSTRDMSEDDAVRVISGDLKDMSHKVAANELGLSYGQVYSARGGYTFRHLTD